MFSRIAIVNRGEAAMRLIHAVRDLAAATAQQIETVALYTDVDRTATFVREADIAYDLGPASARPYLDLKALERALRATKADAAWVGWGFVAEDPAFAELCEQIGVTFIGPSPDAMRKLGDKIGAKLIAEEVGVPVAPWSRGAVESVEAAVAAAAEIGYPLMLKATAGGGGRGIRKINDEAELVDAYERTSQEAARAFGSGVVFLERLVTGARHVEVQVIADGQGTAWALGVRDCSVQRRNQKIIEESASPVLSPQQAADLKASAERLAVAVGYRGAATVEFLYHPGDQLFAFLEVNTRLQVEHPITEYTTGFDLVHAQLHVASGGRLEGEPPAERGHAIEARLNAEDPDRDFAPAPGRIALLDLPAGPGIRVDTGVSEGDTIPADFDSMIAKIIAYGRNREEALGRLRRAVSQTRVIIEGGATNKSFVLDLLDQPEVIDASADTGWIDRVRGEGRLVSQRHSAVALAAAAIEAYEKECSVSVGTQVEAGAPMLRLEPLADDAEAADTGANEPVELDLPAAPARTQPHELLARGQQDMRSLLLGFDVDPHDDRRVIEDYLAARREAIDDNRRPLAEELELIEVFADLAELSHNRTWGDDGGQAHVHSAREYFHTYLQSLDVDRAGLPESYQAKLARALGHYGVTELDRTPELEAAVFRIFLAQQRPSDTVMVVTTLLREWLSEPVPDAALREPVGLALERLVAATQVRFPVIADLTRGLVYAWYGQPLLRRNRARVYANVRKHLSYLDANPAAPDRAERLAEMVRSTEPLVRLLGQRLERGSADNTVMLEVLTRRYYGNKDLVDVRTQQAGGCTFVVAERRGLTLVSAAVSFDDLGSVVAGLAELAGGAASIEADIYLSWEGQPEDFDEMAAALQEVLSAQPLPNQVHRITATVAGSGGAVMHHHFTYRPSATGMDEERLIRGLHPYIAERMQLKRLRKFDLTRLPSSDEEVYLFRCVAKENSSDERLIAFTQVRDLAALREHDGRLLALPTAESTLAACVDGIRRAQSLRGSGNRLHTNRIVMYIWPPLDLTEAELSTIVERVEPSTGGAGLEEILLIARRPDPETGELVKIVVRIGFDAPGWTQVTVGERTDDPVEPIDEYRQKVLRAASRNTVYPYELTGLLGDFTEYDLDDNHALVPVDRPKGRNRAAIVAGVVTAPTERHPQGVTRVVLLGDPTKSLGALSEPECRRVIAALDLAEQMQVPLEWYALSSGARISMTSGTENMDWVAAALKRIVEFTQDGGEINIVVAGINVGAQPYWNAEATMLMHTKGILVMTPDSAMVLTGKQALDFSGGVSAEDNFGIGGYDRVMGPNGQAQYWAPNLAAAQEILMSHYDHTYIAPGEQAPRRAQTSDPIDRDVTGYPHVMADSDFTTVGEIFSATANPDRKKPFDIRTVMRALSDQDHPVLERWAGMADAETAVVQDAHLGGIPVCLLGIESRGIPRRGFPSTDGPDTYTAGTLFPRSSKKAARAINAASGNRPLVVLANLSGFDGSPESMRKLQLEYGAEIGRAIVNFQGPIVFCVISRYHGGAFVVFSKALNPNMTVLALEGSFASVLGGAPAAAAVFSGEVNARTAADPRIQDLETRAANASGTDRAELTAELDELRSSVRAEKLGDVAAEFDKVHNIHRAVEVGSVDAVIRAAELRPRIIEAIEARLGN